ncbi:hypothetical protein [Nesterenkonia haasae]|uniref:hypothetical protein n=1 Tax=Nesterenkonia haasae TaxID=2587813 RepID=UPI001391E044|nr:hypothetical protein [Nesterenkonia haasae]NDK32560.1 hypothetical protein [Nesterenkonia haasae]
MPRSRGSPRLACSPVMAPWAKAETRVAEDVDLVGRLSLCVWRIRYELRAAAAAIVIVTTGTKMGKLLAS